MAWINSIFKKLGITAGVWFGLISALISLLLFATIESVRMVTIIDGSYWNTLQFMVVITLIYGGFFTFIPASVGGYALEKLIEKQHTDDQLTEKRAITSGVFLAGVAVLLACGIGLSVLALVPHNSWRFLLKDIKDGVFFTNLPGYILGMAKQFSHLLPEIIIAIILACISGGFSGKYLAKRELTK